MMQAPGNTTRWYVVEQAGRVISFANVETTPTKSTFIDIETRVNSDFSESGLLGMAFHPDYASNGEVFLSYTAAGNTLTSRVSRFRTLNNGATLDPGTEEILLSVVQPFSNHNGGNIAFGPDGFLYIGFGDGGSSNDPQQNAQNTTNLLGAMLRIDVDGGTPYGIPGSNPFAGNALCTQAFGTDDCPELYAWGLRNPWRWSFDRVSGDLWLGDVGQAALEEVDIIDPGGNYGWPFFEGTRCNTEAPVVNCSFSGLPPVTEYPRNVGRSITGGYVYRGSAIPEMRGVYLYADFITGRLFQFYDPGSGNTVEATLPTGLSISSFGQATDGELYLVDLPSGTLHRIVAAPQ
jgi:glucose/arabinose dehydrogenase